MILAVDVMGFENKINHAIKACRFFCEQNKNVQVILVGDEAQIIPWLRKKDTFFHIKHASDVIKMDDHPFCARKKIHSSMYLAIELVQKNQADGVLSAGNTSCYVFLTTLLLGKIKNVSKIGLMPFIPTNNDQGVNIIDVGANLEVNSDDMLGFAYLGRVFVQKIRRIQTPRIGILNIGTELKKGLPLHIEANIKFSQAKNLNYIGFVEPRRILDDVADLLVIDGFSGNLVLKTLEGVFKTVFRSFFRFYKKPYGWLAFLSSLPVLTKIKKKYNYKNNAGALVLGLKKIAVKTHGSADFLQFFSSLRLLHQLVLANLISHLESQFC